MLAMQKDSMQKLRRVKNINPPNVAQANIEVAYVAGYVAGEFKKSEISNPFVQNTRLWKSWNRGVTDRRTADKQMKKKKGK